MPVEFHWNSLKFHGQKGKYNEADNIVASLELCYHDIFFIFYSILCIFSSFLFLINKFSY